MKNVLRFFGEQIFHRQFRWSEALFHAVAEKDLEGLAIGLDSVGPKISAHQFSDLVRVLACPRERRMNSIVSVDRVDAIVFRFEQCFIKALSDPGMVLVKFFADHHHVHDRKYSRALEMLYFGLARVGK